MPSRHALIAFSLFMLAGSTVWHLNQSSLQGTLRDHGQAINRGPQSTHRGPQSTSETEDAPAKFKNLSLEPKYDLLRHTKKLNPPYQVDVYGGEAPNENGEYTYIEVLPNEQFQITAVVLSKADLSNVEYEWLLPATVQIVSNNMQRKGRLDNIKAHVPLTWKAYFVSTSKSNEKVHLRVKASVGKAHYSLTTQFNTKDQKQIDEEAAQISERHQKYMQDHPELLEKMKRVRHNH